MKTFIKFILTIIFFLTFYATFCLFAGGLFIYNWYIEKKEKILNFLKNE